MSWKSVGKVVYNKSISLWSLPSQEFARSNSCVDKASLFSFLPRSFTKLKKALNPFLLRDLFLTYVSFMSFIYFLYILSLLHSALLEITLAITMISGHHASDSCHSNIVVLCTYAFLFCSTPCSKRHSNVSHHKEASIELQWSVNCGF